MSLTDQDLLSTVQLQLLEPDDHGQSWPSGLWQRDEVLVAANERQNRLLKDTLLLAGLAIIDPVAVGQHRVTLPDDWMRTVGLLWLGNDGTVRELPRSSSFEADHVIRTWEATNQTAPLVYMDDETPLLQIQIAPAPSVAGRIGLVYIPTAIDLTGNGEFLIVPDELEHAIRYGLLADLLSKDGRGRDAERAAYCEDRFELAIEATRLLLKGWA